MKGFTRNYALGNHLKITHQLEQEASSVRRPVEANPSLQQSTQQQAQSVDHSLQLLKPYLPTALASSTTASTSTKSFKCTRSWCLKPRHNWKSARALKAHQVFCSNVTYSCQHPNCNDSSTFYTKRAFDFHMEKHKKQP